MFLGFSCQEGKSVARLNEKGRGDWPGSRCFFLFIESPVGGNPTAQGLIDKEDMAVNKKKLQLQSFLLRSITYCSFLLQFKVFKCVDFLGGPEPGHLNSET